MAEIKQDRITFYVGLPDPKHDLARYRKDGGTIYWVLTPEDAPKFSCPYGDLAILWKDDAEIQAFLFSHIQNHKGGEIAGSNEEMQEKFCQLFFHVVELVNFDSHSSGVLNKNNIPFKNGLRNWRWVEDGIPLKRVKDRGKGFGAVLIAAGPSLDGQWQHLKRLKETGKFLFLTVGRSYEACMRHGIIPEFVVEAEQFEWNHRMFMFAPRPDDDTAICGPMGTDPQIFRCWPNPNKVILLDHETGKAMGMDLNEDTVDGGNSVAHLALNLALHLNCNPICLAGVDLGYPEGLKKPTHAEGTFHIGWGKDVLNQEHSHQGNIPVEANDGTTIESSQPYINFRTFFELQIDKFRKQRPDLKVYSFSKRGQKMRRVEYMELETWTGFTSLLPPSPSSPSSGSAPSSSAASVSSVGSPFPSDSPASTSSTPPTP